LLDRSTGDPTPPLRPTGVGDRVSAEPEQVTAHVGGTHGGNSGERGGLSGHRRNLPYRRAVVGDGVQMRGLIESIHANRVLLRRREKPRGTVIGGLNGEPSRGVGPVDVLHVTDLYLSELRPSQP